MELKIIKELPKDFLEMKDDEILKINKGPILYHLDLGFKNTISISTLLHGNEKSSFYIVQNLLNDTSFFTFNLIVLFGNPLAAYKNKRFTNKQDDFNRMWGENPPQWVKDVMDYYSSLNLYCNIDIHNNTGKNPYYTCVNSLDQKHVQLALHFSNLVIHLENDHNIQSTAVSKYCPSITLETGQSLEQQGIMHSSKVLKNLLKEGIKSRSTKPIIFGIKAQIFLDTDYLYFKSDFPKISHKSELYIVEDIEDFNFKKIEAGTIWGKCFCERPFKILSEDRDVFEEYFFIDEGLIKNKIDFYPSMLTVQKEIIEKDCFGHIMLPKITKYWFRA